MHWWLGPPAFRCLGRPQMHDPPWLVPPVLHHEERSDKPLRCASGTASNPGQGLQEREDRWTPEVSGATSPREPVYLDRTQRPLLGVLLGPIKEEQRVGGPAYPSAPSSSSGSC